MSQVRVKNRSRVWPVPRPWIVSTLRTCLRLSHWSRAELSVLLTGDREIKKLNTLYRGEARATDCLSFPSFQRSELKRNRSVAGVVLGDIVISSPYARKEAVRSGIGIKLEVAWLLVHSYLHLLGHDHITGRERRAMRAMEARYLERVLDRAREH